MKALKNKSLLMKNRRDDSLNELKKIIEGTSIENSDQSI